ncbi:MAG: TolC family protein [Nitrospirota bacterium]
MVSLIHWPVSLRRRLVYFLIPISLVGSVGMPVCSFGQAAEPLQLSELIQEALTNNPEIAAAAQAWAAAKSRISQAGALPDPMLSLRLQNIGPSPSIGEEEMSMAGLSVSQIVPFPGKRSLSEGAALEESRQMEAMLEETRRRVLAELKRLYFELALIKRSEAMVDEIQKLLKTLTETAHARYSVGEGIQQDVLRAQTELTRLTDRRIRLDQEGKKVKAAINAVILRPPGAVLGDPIPIRSPKPVLTEDLFESAATAQSPMIRGSDRTVAAKERMLQMARRDRLPDFELSLGYFDRGRFESLYEAMVSMNLPLYYRSRQGARIREAEADLAGAREGLNQDRQKVRLQVSDLYREITTSDRLRTLIEQGLLPQARLSFESAKAGYEVGKVDFLTLLNNLTSLFEDEIGAEEMRFRYQRALAEMEELTGLDLIGSNH